jgi:glutamate-5-semialdehyde dehydrogenase
MPNLRDLVAHTRKSSIELGLLSIDRRNQALVAIAHQLRTHQEQVLSANGADLALADDLAPALRHRLKLDEKKLQDMIKGLEDLAKLPDPLHHRTIHRQLDENLILQRISCPIGVLGVIFESRPDALVQIAALAIKSGNGAILKGGQEALHSCQILLSLIHQALTTVSIDPHCLELVTTRAEIMEILQMDDLIDLIIPRGSNEFVRYIQTHSRIPVIGHADGICHVFIDREVDREMAVQVTVDSKAQYPAACNAVETLLIHQDIAPEILPLVVQALRAHQVEVRGCSQCLQIVPDLVPATERDWAEEYLDLILAVKIVPSLQAAIDHINHYGSHHTDAILTSDPRSAQEFQQKVDSAGVYHNCSTRFADGFRYGFGAEVGISTQKIPPRGPVGLEGLVTYKYLLSGRGETVADYTMGKSFLHRDLPL